MMMHLDAGLTILVPKHYYGVHLAAFAKEPPMLADEFRLLGRRQSMPAFAAEVGQETNVAFGPNLVHGREFLSRINGLTLRHNAVSGFLKDVETGRAETCRKMRGAMAGIKGKDTKPELVLRRALHARGFRYRLHSKNVPGRPDLVFPKHHAIVFVHGCFWHRYEGCRYTTTPSTRPEFWQAKFDANVI